MSYPLLVTARLASAVAADAPRLDALLEYVLSLHHAKGVPGYKIDRSGPAPPQAEIPIPIARRSLGPWQIAMCSDPIYGLAPESVEHVAKRVGVENAAMLDPSSRVVVATTNSWTKSHRLPLRMRLVERVAWFAVGYRRELLKVLRRVEFLGKKRSIGNGRVAGWSVERCELDCSWFAPSDRGPVLMATLPAGDWLPAGLAGYRNGFGGCCPPYWHPERYTEIVVPC